MPPNSDSRWIISLHLSSAVIHNDCELPPIFFRVITVRAKIIRFFFIPTLLWNIFLGRLLKVRHWWDALTEEPILLGALPFSRDVPQLQAEGVTGVINMCIEYPGPKLAYEKSGIDQLWLPTVDFTPPTIADIRQAIEFIERHQKDGGKVYVHCKAGRGRSATVVLCWLMYRRGFTPEEAAVWLARQRPHINRDLAERVVVRDFHETLSAGESAIGAN